MFYWTRLWLEPSAQCLCSNDLLVLIHVNLGVLPDYRLWLEPSAQCLCSDDLLVLIHVNLGVLMDYRLRLEPSAREACRARNRRVRLGARDAS